MYYTFMGFANGKWRYKATGWETSKDVDTFALERVLGVVGGPEVMVTREDLRSRKVCHVTVKNGFITSVETVQDDGNKEPLKQFTFKEISL